MTGEKKTRTIRPDRSLFGGPGAVEVAARYEELRFDDVENEGFESAGSRARQRPPCRLPRVHERAQLVAEPLPPPRRATWSSRATTDALRAPTPGKKGNYVTLLGRVQVHLP